LQQFATMFDNLTKAWTDEYKARQVDQEVNEELLSELPDDPDRGSYYFWVKLSRQYTGAHFLDSGRAYGYGYNRPFKLEHEDPINVELWDNEILIYQSLPHFLHQTLDATDPIAVALEEVLHWVGNELYPNENWMYCANHLSEMLVDHIHYGEPDFTDFPDEAFIKLVEANVQASTEWGGTWYTYNHENDLDQDFHCDGTYESEESGDLYVIIRTHNGCDA